MRNGLNLRLYFAINTFVMAVSSQPVPMQFAFHWGVGGGKCVDGRGAGKCE
jgi:hypothetical protein